MLTKACKPQQKQQLLHQKYQKPQIISYNPSHNQPPNINNQVESLSQTSLSPVLAGDINNQNNDMGVDLAAVVVDHTPRETKNNTQSGEYLGYSVTFADTLSNDNQLCLSEPLGHTNCDSYANSKSEALTTTTPVLTSVQQSISNASGISQFAPPEACENLVSCVTVNIQKNAEEEDEDREGEEDKMIVKNEKIQIHPKQR